MIYGGDLGVQRMYIGDQEVTVAFKGRDVIWSKRLGGSWRFEFPGRSGAYSLNGYCDENERLHCEKTSFPIVAKDGYPGLVFTTANPIQYSSHQVFYLLSGLLAPSTPDDVLIELELFLIGADNGAISVGLFDNAIGMVFDKTGLEVNLAPRLWCGENSERSSLGSTWVDGMKIEGYDAGHVALWVSPSRGFVRSYQAHTLWKEIPFSHDVWKPDAHLNVRFANSAAFITTPTFPPVTIPVFPPGLHAVVQHTGEMARRRAAELGYT